MLDEDIIHIETKDKWILQGIKYAEKALNSTFNRMSSANPYYRMKNLVKGIIPELAFEELLETKNVMYEKERGTKWYDVDRYSLTINTHKCDIKSFFLDLDSSYLESKNIGDLSPSSTKWLLDCAALVPSDQLKAKSMIDDDFYIFAFVTGKLTPDNGCIDLDSFQESRYKKYFIHSFWEYAWVKPQKFIKAYGPSQLGRITIISNNEDDHSKEIVIGGTSSYRKFMFEKVILKGNPPKSKTQNSFFQLFYVHVPNGMIPQGTLTIKAETDMPREIIEPKFGFKVRRKTREKVCILQNDWENIWIYDTNIYFVGYMKKGEFKEHSRAIPRFYKNVKQYQNTMTANNLLEVSELHSLDKFLQDL
ncbi:MAG: hypothetical protein ACFFB5_13790 [Promethearchaeota archaeon]